ncbi:Phospholipid-translocating_ATPase [Hexamita inflata]|uniref:Phospholipid-translocating ATPase n=1 Tax=Hexamita inflata TaxID=28002 RepID=A0AA86Q466_9EUKA|nr:Phospholipid-translocating ATPase [Hexamita inflata]
MQSTGQDLRQTRPSNLMFLNIVLNKINEKKAKTNKIKTTKYTVWNFIFVFLFQQYQKVFNIFTLVIAICNTLPFANVVSQATIIMPIVFVLGIAAVREIIEDFGRRKQDKYQNNQKYTVFRNMEERVVKGQDIMQGDLIKIDENQEVPCDSLLLYSSEASKIAYVNTSQLDGESNLKTRIQLIPFHSESYEMKKLQQLSGSVQTMPNTSEINKFQGQIALNLVPEAALFQKINSFPSEQSIVPAVEHVDPSLSISAKNSLKIPIVFQTETTQEFSSSFNVENSLLRGMRLQNTNFALCAAVHVGMDAKILCNNKKIKAKTSRIEKRLNQLLIILVVLVVILTVSFALVSTFYHKNINDIWFSLEPQSVKMRIATRMLQFLIICSYFLPISLMVGLELSRFFQSMIVSADQQMIRSDLKELVIQKKFVRTPEIDAQAPCQMQAQVNNSISVENMAEVDIIFSDKTGTLTKNEMSFSQTVNGSGKVSRELRKTELFALALCNTILPRQIEDTLVYQGESPDEIAFVTAAKEAGLTLVQRDADKVYYDFKTELNKKAITVRLTYQVLAVIPFSSFRKRMTIIMRELGTEVPESFGGIRYFGTPEEICQPGQEFSITKGADNVMMKLSSVEDFQVINREIDHLSEQGLRTLVFSSRKLQPENTEPWLKEWNKTKLLPDENETYQKVTREIESDLRFIAVSAIEDKLQDGVFDTLTSLRQADIKIWMLTGDKTLTAISIAKSTGLSNKSNRYLYFTNDTIAEKMKQNNVTEREQAIDIILYEAITEQIKAMSEAERMEYNAQTTSKFKKAQKELLSAGQGASLIHKHESIFNLPFTVVIDADFFREVLRIQQHFKLFQIAFSSQAVICCRLSPQEKAIIVTFCHHYHPSLTTLSIGDGANDTPMIKAAQVGVGIAGKEGLHACGSADVSIPEFQMIKRMIFVHGRLNHLRNSELIDYSIYKNSMLVFINLIFQFFQKFSGQIATESFMLMMFNTIITFISIFFYSVVEKDVYPSELEKYPQALPHFKKRYNSNLPSIFRSIAFAFYGALILLLLTKYYYGYGQLVDSAHADFYFFQSMIMICAVFVSIVKVYISTRHFNTATFVAMSVSVLISYLAQVVGNFLTSFGVGQNGLLQYFYSGPGPSLYCFMASCLVLVPVVLEHFMTAFFNPDPNQILMNDVQRHGCIREVYTEMELI